MTPIRRYSRGRKLVAMRDVQAGTTRYYHYDHQGTTQCLTDGNGNVTDRFAADAWGVQIKRTGSSINRQWYIGNWGYYREQDGPTAYSVRNRTLTAKTGLWLSKDPLDSGRDVRPYNYAVNSPSGFIDPAGLAAEPACLCCCCPLSISGFESRPATFLDLPLPVRTGERIDAIRDALSRLGLDDAVLGHRFAFTINLSYVTSDKSSRCRIEWWECSNDPPVRNRQPRWPVPGVWANLTGPFLSTSAHSGAWTRENDDKTNPMRCPSTRHVRVSDLPTIGRVDPQDRVVQNARRVLYIFARVRKGATCSPCGTSEVTIRIIQDLEISQGKVARSSIAPTSEFPGGDPGEGKKCQLPEGLA